MALGIGLSLLVDGRVVAGSTIHATVTSNAVLMSMLVSVGIGIFFGFYPASRAARLPPIEALRYEVVARGGPHGVALAAAPP